MGVPNPVTKFQGAYVTATACTIRLTYDPLGVPITSDLVVAAGSWWRSVDAFLAAWEAQIEADVGGSWTVWTGDAPGYVQIVSPGAAFSVTWSFAGDGTGIRDWLGAGGDLIAVGPNYDFGSRHRMWFQPELPAQTLSRRATGRPRGRMVTLSGAHRGQHETSYDVAASGSIDEVLLTVGLAFGPTAPLTEEAANFELFLEQLTTYGTGMEWTIYHGTEAWYCGFASESIELAPRRVYAGWQQLWRLDFDVRLLEAAA